MSLLNKEPVKRAEKFLKDFDQSLEVIVLENSARTAQDAAGALDCNVGAIVKSLLFKTENTFTLCLVAGDRKVSLNKIKKELEAKGISVKIDIDKKKRPGYKFAEYEMLGVPVRLGLGARDLEKNEVDFALVSVLPKKVNLNSEILLENKLYLIGDKDVVIPSKPFEKSIFNIVSVASWL